MSWKYTDSSNAVIARVLPNGSMESMLATALTTGEPILLADMPSPNVAILTKIAGIESSTQVPRIVRESLMRAEERAANQDASLGITAASILASNLGYQRVKAVDDQIRALRAQIK